MIKFFLFILCLQLLLAYPTQLLAKDLKKVTLQLEWKHQFEFAGFYAAIAQGYYKEVGLDIELKEFHNGINIIDEVLNKHATFGISSSALIIDKLQHKPVVLLASYFKQNALALVTRPEIKHVHDLKNKTIMAVDWEISSTSIGAMLLDAGIDKTAFNLIPHDFEVDKFINGKIDAMSIFITSQPHQLDQAGIQYNILNPAQYGIYSYDLELFSSEAIVSKSPQMVKDFVSATNKGWEYAFNHKTELVNLIYHKYSTRKSKSALLYEADKTEEMFKLNLFKIGSIIPELIKLNTDVYVKLGLVDKDYDLNTLFMDYFDTNSNKKIYEQPINYSLLIKLLAAAILFVLFYVYREITLRQYNKKLSLEVEKQVNEIHQKNEMLLNQNKLASMGEMLNNIAHQWRQPIATLNGVFANLDYEFENKKLDSEEFIKYLNDAETITHYMSKTIEDFRNLFSPDKISHEFDLQEMIEQSIHILKLPLRQQNIELITDIQNTARINSHQSELMQVIIVLVNNAKDVLLSSTVEHKKITLTVTSTPAVQKELHIITVSDNGGGVPEDLLDKIFEPYFSTKHESHGTGLGLYMARAVVEKSLSGSLSVKNNNDGACFTISL
ncbi:MAG: ABC transporter substrate-binding protein [gamma proteobacterium symbiont of Taylorina sp.]|nr:ABC transporter substrate-binding protein [gamma proteobacterium symbiont of Taylorina sp.]